MTVSPFLPNRHPGPPLLLIALLHRSAFCPMRCSNDGSSCLSLVLGRWLSLGNLGSGCWCSTLHRSGSSPPRCSTLVVKRHAEDNQGDRVEDTIMEVSTWISDDSRGIGHLQFNCS